VKILLVHNRYQVLGGEDEVYCRERQLLLSHGHNVIEYTRDNREIAEYGARKKATLVLRTTWAWDSYGQVAAVLAEEKPNLAHFHNTFPLISPAAYYACSAAGVPVVQTLHNSRLLCPAGTLFRNGRTCQECAGRRVAFPAVLHGCYHQSRVHSAVVASTLSIHHWLGTWTQKISSYIASTEFYRAKFVAAGLPSEKIALKPHFVDPDPGCTEQKGEYALFVGRLVPEKGVPTLLTAWQQVRTAPLFILGEGPLAEAVSMVQAQTGGRVTLLPRASRSVIVDLMKAARFLVWPSYGYYETFGLVAIEAFACGIPVIASASGVMKEIVQDGCTGLHFIPGDADDLAKKVEWAWEHPVEMREMGQNARGEYQAKYAAERNYEILSQIYQSVLCTHAEDRLSHWLPRSSVE
jgi:glycosyltransferase involved in cell wall biosynthesis